MIAYWAHLFAYGAHLNLNYVLMIILLLIFPFLGLLFWLENKVSDSVETNNHDFKWKELVQISDEINSVFINEQDEDNNISACSFCGRFSDKVTRCSRCKVAIYCSNACHVMHRRFCDKYQCNDQWESPSHGFQCLLMEPENDHTYSINEIEQRRYREDVYYIEREEEKNRIELPQRGIVNRNGDGCAVCGNPSSKVCSRCKNIKYCSRTCQHSDWRLGHKFQCLDENANSTQAAMVNQERPAHGQVLNPTISYEVEDNTHHSSSTLCLEFYSVSNNSRALVSSSLSQETANNSHRKVEEQLRILKEDLTKIKDENISLQSERDEWELRARNSIDRLYNFRKENEHQHENELTSNAEKQARQMVNSLSQRLHCLQIAVENGVEERKKQEEYIHMLQNEYAKAKLEIQEQKKCIERLKLKTTQFPMGITEGTRHKLVNGSSEIADVESNAAGAEVSQPISLSRNPTFTRQGCSICLTNEKNVAFGCGHMTCTECGTKIRKCHICRKKITTRIRLYPD